MNKKAILVGVAGGAIAFGLIYLIAWYMKKRAAETEVQIIEGQAAGADVVQMTQQPAKAAGQ